MKRRFTRTLTVFKAIKNGVPPSTLWKKKILSEMQVKHSLSLLRKQGIIIKIGYGTWETTTPYLTKAMIRRFKNTHRVGGAHTPPLNSKNEVRAHGIVATLELRRFRNWENREKVLKKLKIKYKKIPQGQRISWGRIRKLWLCKNSIVFYLPFYWFAETSAEAKKNIIYDLIEVIKQIESKFGVSFRKRKGYKIKVDRQHYALIKNALARQYNDDKKKLYVYDENGLWLLIDNSHNLHETETVHPKTAVEDNMKIQNFFNGIKTTGITPDQITEWIGKMVQEQQSYRDDLLYYGKNIVAHTEAIKRLGYIMERVENKLNGRPSK